MRRLVKIVEPDEYEEWLAGQTSYYMSNIRNTENDPFLGQLLDVEILERDRELTSEFKTAIDSEESSSLIRLKNVFFETGSAELKDDSKYELNKLASLINENEGITVEITGHTDSTGDADANMVLSNDRANAVVNYLSEKGVSGLSSRGYGSTQPVDSNDTEEGRKNNRRTEIIITK